jgi:hypothetical protein
LPLSLSGDLTQPSFSLLTDVVTHLAARTLECEKNKAIDKLKEKGTQQLKSEAEKALKGLFGH